MNSRLATLGSSWLVSQAALMSRSQPGLSRRTSQEHSPVTNPAAWAIVVSLIPLPTRAYSATPRPNTGKTIGSPRIFKSASVPSSISTNHFSDGSFRDSRNAEKDSLSGGALGRCNRSRSSGRGSGSFNDDSSLRSWRASRSNAASSLARSPHSTRTQTADSPLRMRLLNSARAGDSNRARSGASRSVPAHSSWAICCAAG